jgi:hypothetical protein
MQILEYFRSAKQACLFNIALIIFCEVLFTGLKGSFILDFDQQNLLGSNKLERLEKTYMN